MRQEEMKQELDNLFDQIVREALEDSALTESQIREVIRSTVSEIDFSGGMDDVWDYFWDCVSTSLSEDVADEVDRVLFQEIDPEIQKKMDLLEQKSERFQYQSQEFVVSVADWEDNIAHDCEKCGGERCVHVMIETREIEPQTMGKPFHHESDWEEWNCRNCGHYDVVHRDSEKAHIGHCNLSGGDPRTGYTDRMTGYELEAKGWI